MWSTHAHKQTFPANLWNTNGISLEYPAYVSADSLLTVSRAMKLGPGRELQRWVWSFTKHQSAYLWLHQSMTRDSEFLDCLEDIHHIVNIQSLYDVKESTECSTSALTVTVKQKTNQIIWRGVHSIIFSFFSLYLKHKTTVILSYHILIQTAVL